MGTKNMENSIAAMLGGRFEVSPLTRQHSIYSQTLDEFQNAHGDFGKQFGSMNMDQFLKNVCTAEENQAMAAAMAVGGNELAAYGLLWQGSLPRQGSLTLPRTVSRKTVDDVFKDINQMGSGGFPIVSNDSGSAHGQQQSRELTFGETTLQEFLLKAGVVREEMRELGKQPTSMATYVGGLRGDYGLGAGGCNPIRRGEILDVNLNDSSALLGTSYANQEGGYNAEGKCERENFSVGAKLSLSSGTLPSASQCRSSITADQLNPNCETATTSSWLNRTGYNGMASLDTMAPQQHQQPTVRQQQVDQRSSNWTLAEGLSTRGCYGTPEATGIGGLGSGFVGKFASGKTLGTTDLGASLGGKMDVTYNLALSSGSPSSLSDEQNHRSGLSTKPAGNYGLEGAFWGRKRGADHLTYEKVIERRQRRMIKNRESAARSRARKQAYTVELEAEVTQLKDENYKLRKQQEDAGKKKKQLINEQIMNPRMRLFSSTAKGLRRTTTGPW